MGAPQNCAASADGGAAAGGIEYGKGKTSLTYLMELALLVGILLMMNITGLAMIPLPGQYASIMTVPVAVGAMMLGPLAGGVLGA